MRLFTDHNMNSPNCRAVKFRVETAVVCVCVCVGCGGGGGGLALKRVSRIIFKNDFSLRFFEGTDILCRDNGVKMYRKGTEPDGVSTYRV